LPAADVTCARISNARHLPVEETLRPFANGLGGPRESSNEFTGKAFRLSTEQKFVPHVLVFLSA
jgi:hypothetical protein